MGKSPALQHYDAYPHKVEEEARCVAPVREGNGSETGGFLELFVQPV